MTRKKLRPNLATIEARLCGPSDGLLRRWLDGDPSLPAGLIEQLEGDPEAVARRQRLEQAIVSEVEDDLGAAAPTAERPARPDLLLRFSTSVRRRADVASTDYEHELTAGQIRHVQRLCTPDGASVPWDFPQPVAIVLRAPASPGSPVWYAWIASPDVDYASYWDMVLEPRDEPFDPRAALVQAWNAVLVDTRGVGPAVGQLSSERLASLEALSNDFLDGPAVGHEWSAPGELIQRTVEGHAVVTGTPYGRPGEDPRLEYQSLYHAAAEPLRAHARVVLGPETAAESRSNVVDFNAFLRRQAERQRGSGSQPAYQYQSVDRLAKAASSDGAASEISHVFGGLVSVSFHEVPESEDLTLCVLELVGRQSVHIQVARNDRVIVDTELSSVDPREELTFQLTDKLALRVMSPASFEVQLSPIDD